MDAIKVQLDDYALLNCCINADKTTIDVSIFDTPSIVVSTADTVIKVPFAEVYDGCYDVIPSALKQTVLNTKDKHMVNDVTVTKIPRYDVSNVYGGETCYIAEVID